MSEKNNNNMVYGIVAVLVIALVAGIAIYSYNMNKNNSSSNSSSSSAMMSSEGVMVGGAAMLSSRNIIQNVSNASNLTTLVTAVKAAGLVDTLSGPGPFTVFGPTNDAFAKLPAGTVETLVKPENKAQLTSILTYHVVSGKYAIADLKDGQELTTVNGAKLKVTKNGNTTMVNGAKIETPDVFQSNGVAHVIDTVLMPADAMPKEDQGVLVGGVPMLKTRNLIENVSMAPNLKTVVAAVTAAGLVDTLKGPGPFTVFGPDDTAFAKLPAGTVETLVKPENKAQLTSILTYHVVMGNYKIADLKDGQVLTTVNGAKLTIKKDGSKTMIMGGTSTNIATITTPDVLQSNGVAHVIDTVLMPPTA